MHKWRERCMFSSRRWSIVSVVNMGRCVHDTCPISGSHMGVDTANRPSQSENRET